MKTNKLFPKCKDCGKKPKVTIELKDQMIYSLKLKIGKLEGENQRLRLMTLKS